jgi:hypothetical protein
MTKVTLAPAGAAATTLDAARFQTVAGRQLVPVAHTNAFSIGSESNGTDLMATYEQSYTLTANCRNLTLLFAGLKAGFTRCSNEFYVQASAKLTTSAGTYYVPFSFADGGRVGRVDPGSLIATGPLDLDFFTTAPAPPGITASATLTIRLLVYVDQSGKKWPHTRFGGSDFNETGVDKLLTGTMNTNGGSHFGPALILGSFLSTPGRPSMALFGDSIGQPLSNGPTSQLGVALPNIPVTNLCVAVEKGAQVYSIPDIHVHRQALASHHTNATWEYGRNSMDQTVASLQNELLTWALRQRRRGVAACFATTIGPSTSSTDGWVTVNNQTPTVPAYDVTRNAYNNWLRDGSPVDPTTLVAVATGAAGLRAGQAGHPLAYVGCAPGPNCTQPGYWELADTLESARGSNKFKAGHTGDGLHPNSTGLAAISAAFSTTPLAA